MTDNSVSAVGQKIGKMKNVFGSVLLRLTHVNVTLNKADRHKSRARNSISHSASQSVRLFYLYKAQNKEKITKEV